MDGSLLLARISELRADALLDGEEFAATLIAAVYAEALRTGGTPRGVLDDLWKSFPADELWRDGTAEQLDRACEDLEDY